MKKLFLQVLFFFGGGLLFFYDVWAQGVFISVSDITAGEVNQIRVSGLLGNEEIGLVLSRPNKTEILFSETADDLGVIDTEIFGLHLRDVGLYELKVQRHFNPKDFLVQSFSVVPGIVSAYQSKIVIKNPSVEADGEVESFFIVKLRDAYGNFVKNKSVKVFSSRNEDVLVAEELSDEYGEISGRVKSQTPGISILSALSDDLLLFDKSEVVFHLSDPTLKNVGASDFGRFLKAQIMGDDESMGEVSFFSIEDLPREAFLEKNYTFRVVAKDEDGAVAKNYTGKVRFASGDIQANLPADYTFSKEDQGVHTFALAVMFGTAGQHAFKVHDVSDYSIMANSSATVADKDRLINPGQKPDKIEIETPRAGFFKSSRMTISGTAVGAEFLKIEDGPTLLVDELEVESDGSFVYQTPALADGVHKFRVSSTDETLVSEVVSVQIDQTPPSVMAVDIDPSETVDSGDNFQLKISSSDPLSEASCVFMEVETSLDSAGDKFVGNFQAPQQCGTYPISCSISDLLGNKLEEPNAAVLQVCTGESGNKDQDTDGDGTMDREEVMDNDGDGVPNFLESSILDSTGNGIPDQEDPDNDTDLDGVSNSQGFSAGFLPFNTSLFKLINATSDADGDGVLDKDEILDLDQDLVPNILESNTIGAHNDDSNDYDGGGVSNRDEIINGTNVFDSADDQSNVSPTSISNFSAESGTNKITLFWSPAKDDKVIEKYRIEFGTEKEALTQSNLVPDNRTQWYIDELEEGTAYYFRVLALDAEGNVSVPSNVIEVATLGENLHKTAPKQNPTSGISFWLPFLLAGMVGFFLLGGLKRG